MTMTRGDGGRPTGRDQAPGLMSGARRAQTAGPRARTRSRGLIGGAIVLVLGSGLATAWLVLNAGNKESVVSVTIPASCHCDHLAKGQTIPRSWLTSSSVSGVSGTVPIADIDQVAGMTATTDLFSGEVLTKSMYSSASVPGPGQASVGLSLDPARVPDAGLEAGDIVDVVEVPPSNAATGANPGSAGGNTGGNTGGASLDNPPILAHHAAVYAVQGDATQGGGVLVTIVVDADSAASVSAYSAQGQVALVETAAPKQATTTPGAATNPSSASSNGNG